MTEAFPVLADASMHCHNCRSNVPAGAFCGNCGAHLAPRAGDGPAWLRSDVFCAAPHESVARPSLASTLLPQLSELTRRPFNMGLVLIVIAMAVLVELHLPGGLITVASLGLPLLLLTYWHRSGVLSDIPRWAVVTTVVLAVALAVGWVLMTGDLVVSTAASPFESGSAGRRVLRDGLGVAEGGSILMLLPAGIVRLLWRGRRDSLTGFVIGVLSALLFTAAATLTRLAPQFISAPIARTQPVQWLFFEAAVRGVAVPVTAACAGGLVGTTLWFHRHREASRLGSWRVIVGLALAAVTVLGVYAVVGWADIEGVSQVQVLSWHVAMALVALVSLRIGLQLTLLHERTDPPTGVFLLCLHCRHVVPEMAFCPACGAADRAAPERSRQERRRVSPEVLVAQDDSAISGDTALWPGYAAPERIYTAARLTRQSPTPVLATWLVGMTVLSAIFIGLPALTVRPAPRYNCPPDCGTPMAGQPVSANPRFTAPGGLFSVAYPAPGSAYEVTTDDTGVTAKFAGGDGGELRLTSQRATEQTARDVAKEFIGATFPTARKSFEIPNAMVGFQPGYGEVDDVFPLDLDTSFTRMRVIVIVAVKNDLALIAAATGPFHEFGPKFGPGRPSPANVQIAEDMGRYVNSFQWKGDPPR
ncbi:zinc ribbon domain-containing protein [Mycobacterium crocinum]|nr:zinc ribbon domain-containing protein [Mycolicibacterium crocinum]